MFVETSVSRISKYNEELCGDNVEIVETEDSKIIVLSDGLGSGVKANILSTLTTKIASRLLEKGIPLEEVVDTITNTLPVCKERQLAYSTLSILQIFNDGRAYLVEIDNPDSFFIDSKGNISKIETKKRRVGDKEVREARFQLKNNEMIMLISDGVTHAGVGGLLNFGLGWDGIAEHFERIISKYQSSNKFAEELIEVCNAYYCMEPGDDTTTVIAYFREERELTLFSGPPKNIDKDKEVVDKLISKSGKRVIAGGTSAQIVARELDEELEVSLLYHDPEIPPTSRLDGVDLVTEGLLTLNKTVERLKNVSCQEDLPKQRDGATELARLLLESDSINMLIGKKINPAHQSLRLPENMAIRKQIIKRLVDCLKEKGKKVTIEWF
ncbi:stage II sporulation protein E [Orenia metallireducens]|uniref:Stage II sporulation protein E (SpoIIE) n=1 Tax=Orenia metallireducens TaxID=1413210 RepID=A0A285GYH3_9FIRM|nr:SpoIIE family protein phosphatase [Orenia metallireducens]PRX26427.1 stage II sporulation protein E [Orenia metallireducens]SNY28547.1 Stage II sporulation protein E (SpoIIE) [Orenia metallireducens]